MLKSKRLTTPQEVKTFSNPFRFKIINLFTQGKTPLTVKQMADKLGQVPSKVHYHVKALEKIGVLEIVETKDNSGITEKYYLPTAENFYVDQVVKTSKNNVYDDGQDDFIGVITKEIIKNLDDFRDNVNPNEDAGRLVSNLEGYLTPAETRELHDMCVDYIKSRKRTKDSKPFFCSLLTIKKFNNTK
ncbi:ArsR/SmtB family transcription factor [Haloimpatiens massiliensis]|uniref:ArsR/SmtB family transcription factor n=1 Tax=Haloimpatiens massiliensis TaxID=1658110 RepID=UPI000C815CE8|nr:helix-turn-helix domain-containing protein [Haloimpatiens massiliensis]